MNVQLYLYLNTKTIFICPWQFQEEVLSAYQQIRSLCSTIRHQEQLSHRNNKHRARNHSEDSLDTNSTSSSSHLEDFQASLDIQVASLQIGVLNDSVLELKGLCLNMMQNSQNNGHLCHFCNPEAAGTATKQSEMMNLAFKQRETEIKKKDEEIVALQSQVSFYIQQQTYRSCQHYESKVLHNTEVT